MSSWVCLTSGPKSQGTRGYLDLWEEDRRDGWALGKRDSRLEVWVGAKGLRNGKSKGEKEMEC